MADDEIIEGLRLPSKFDTEVDSQDDAERLVRVALPHADELTPAEPSVPYPPPPPEARHGFRSILLGRVPKKGCCRTRVVIP